MRLPLIKYRNITLTIITILRTQSPLSLLFLVRLGGYIVNSLDCYSRRIVGKLTDFFEDLRIILNIDGSPITSRTYTLPSHSETSRLLTSSLSLGVPVPPTIINNNHMWVLSVSLTFSFSFIQLYHLVFHHTDTHIQVFYLVLVLLFHNKQINMVQSTRLRHLSVCNKVLLISV
jgi:hypothetical protein